MTEQYHVISYKIRKTVKLEVGLHPDAKLGEARPYRDILPVAFYGSSIVHGTAAGRPGLIYPAISSRELNLDFYDSPLRARAYEEAPPEGEPISLVG